MTSDMPPYCYIDFETNSLDVNTCKIYCCVCKVNGEIFDFADQYAQYPLEALPVFLNSQPFRFVAHNGIRFDFILLKRLGILTPYIVDTLIDAKLILNHKLLAIQDEVNNIPTKLRGSFSLEAFGYRLGIQKKEWNDFSKFSHGMLRYCMQDVNVLERLHKFLSKTDIDYQIRTAEYRVAYLIKQQEDYGFYFDILNAYKLAKKLKSKMNDLEDKFTKLYPARYKADGDVKEPKRITKKLVGPYQHIKRQEFNINSRQQIQEKLSELGYEFKIFTATGKAKINKDTIADATNGKEIAEYLKLAKDYSQIEGGVGSLMNCYNHKTHRIHGKCDTLGANTHRFTHNSPNMTQVPKTPEFRNLFIPSSKERILVGIDADALELMMLGYYLTPYDKGEYLHSVAFGTKEQGNDVHTLTQKKTGLPTRDKAKTFTYATLYGSGALKLGMSLYQPDVDIKYSNMEYQKVQKQLENKIIEMNGKKLFELDKDSFIEWNDDLILKALYGAQVKSEFFSKTTGINDLIAELEKQYDSSSTIKSLDNREIFSSSKHKCLNVLLQSSGAIFMKYYLLNVYYALLNKYRLNKDYAFVCNIHDAIVIECDTPIAQDIANEMEKAFTTTSNQFDFLYKVKGSPIIGDTLYKIF